MTVPLGSEKTFDLCMHEGLALSAAHIPHVENWQAGRLSQSSVCGSKRVGSPPGGLSRPWLQVVNTRHGLSGTQI